MKKQLLSIFLSLAFSSIYAGDIRISFAATGAATTVGSVTVENLTKGTSVTLNGTDVLVLSGTSDIDDIASDESIDESIKVIPNPMGNEGEIRFHVPVLGKANISIFDATGKLIVRKIDNLQIGTYSYLLKGLPSGIFFVNVAGNRYSYNATIVSLGNASQTVSLNQISSINDPETQLESNLKGLKSDLSMDYTIGDNLKFTATTGIYSAWLSDKPTKSKTLTFNFTSGMPNYSNTTPSTASLDVFVSNATVTVNTPVTFTVPAGLWCTPNCSFGWDFGTGIYEWAGTGAPVQTISHTFTQVGTYIVYMKHSEQFAPYTFYYEQVITVVSGTTNTTPIVKEYNSIYLNPPMYDFSSNTFMSTSTGTPVTVTAAATVSNTIDIGYFYGNTAKAALACPFDYLTTAYDLTSGSTAFSTRNFTSYAKANVTYASVSTIAGLKTAYQNGTLATNGTVTQPSARIYNLAIGDVIAFKTAAGKYGLLQVVNIVGTTGSYSYIQLNMKIESTSSTSSSAPVASFNASSTTANVGTSISFTDNSTGTPTSWSWSFGDGTTSTSQNPSHSYSTAGTYTVTLIASNSNGSNTTTKTITVSTGGTISVASFTSSNSGLSASFTDRSSNSPTSWSWSFGDGTTSSTQSPSHTYSTAGTYTVKLTASNSYGGTSASNTITVTASSSNCVGTGTKKIFRDGNLISTVNLTYAALYGTSLGRVGSCKTLLFYAKKSDLSASPAIDTWACNLSNLVKYSPYSTTYDIYNTEPNISISGLGGCKLGCVTNTYNDDSGNMSVTVSGDKYEIHLVGYSTYLNSTEMIITSYTGCVEEISTLP